MRVLSLVVFLLGIGYIQSTEPRSKQEQILRRYSEIIESEALERVLENLATRMFVSQVTLHNFVFPSDATKIGAVLFLSRMDLESFLNVALPVIRKIRICHRAWENSISFLVVQDAILNRSDLAHDILEVIAGRLWQHLQLLSPLVKLAADLTGNEGLLNERQAHELISELTTVARVLPSQVLLRDAARRLVAKPKTIEVILQNTQEIEAVARIQEEEKQIQYLMKEIQAIAIKVKVATSL